MKKPLADRLRLWLFFWLPVFIWSGSIFFVSSIPGKDLLDVGFPHADKIVHAGEYLVLGALLARALRRSFEKAKLTSIVALSIVLAAAFAALDEWHQRFVPDRTCDPVDFATDVAALSFGVFLYKKREEIARDKAV